MKSTVLALLLISVIFYFADAQSRASGQLEVKPTITRGMVIDAGSGGSRLHVFTWQPRIFYSIPPPLSYPEANEKWTARMSPGIHVYASDPSKVSEHLAPLIDFARLELVGYEHEFQDYPIYFKATGGMRQLPANQRDAIINEVRRLLSDKSFCPFNFRDDLARVISGEEEAIYSWAATNFLMGTLLPNSQGVGMVEDVNCSYGTLDLGGASTQIAYYVPSQDILEGLYKLQLGGQKSWNVYTKSFLEFGIVSARLRHINYLVDEYLRTNPNTPLTTTHKIENPCFHSGYSEQGSDSNGLYMFEIIGVLHPSPNQLALCRASILPLLEKTLDNFCNKVYHGDCSLTGSYQPPLPTGRHGHFIGTSSYLYPWSFLLLPSTASLTEFEVKAKEICSYSFPEVMLYNENHQITVDNEKTSGLLPYYCFLSSYVLTLLEDGYNFQPNQTITVMDQINGHKVGWALGAILYEINDLPWEMHLNAMEKHPLVYVLAAAVIGFTLGAIASYYVYREIIVDSHGTISNSSGKYYSPYYQEYSPYPITHSASITMNNTHTPHTNHTNYHTNYHTVSQEDINASYNELKRLNTIDLMRLQPSHSNTTAVDKIDSPYQPTLRKVYHEEGENEPGLSLKGEGNSSSRRQRDREEAEAGGGAGGGYHAQYQHHLAIPPGHVPGYYYPPPSSNNHHSSSYGSSSNNNSNSSNPYQYFQPTPTATTTTAAPTSSPSSS